MVSNAPKNAPGLMSRQWRLQSLSLNVTQPPCSPQAARQEEFASTRVDPQPSRAKEKPQPRRLGDPIDKRSPTRRLMRVVRDETGLLFEELDVHELTGVI